MFAIAFDLAVADTAQHHPKGAAQAYADIGTGEALIAAMQASPYRDINIEPGRAAMPVRDVTP